MPLDSASIDYLLDTCRMAGVGILEVYGEDFAVKRKTDHSPVTEADLRAHRLITQRLCSRWPDTPVLSEEAAEKTPYEVRKHWTSFWLVDPLDGTKEFIKRNGQFTVNIALVEHGRPAAGFVYAPVTETAYYGTAAGAFKVTAGERITLPSKTAAPDGTLRVVASLSHSNRETELFLEEARGRYKSVKLVAMGSSLKICLVAEGAADVYPRFGPTMEWDTAAAHAVVRAAGRDIYEFETREPLRYNKPDLHNPWFVVE